MKHVYGAAAGGTTRRGAVKAGLGKFGEAMRRELKDEGVHVLTIYPGATDTPMMTSNRAWREQGSTKETAAEVAAATIATMEKDSFEAIRGGEARAKTIILNREDPAVLDKRFAGRKAGPIAGGSRPHGALGQTKKALGVTRSAI